jgi:hypothetical protein
MKKIILTLLAGSILIFSSCEKETVEPYTPTTTSTEEEEETVYTNLLINYVKVTAIPNADDSGVYWDNDGTVADIRVKVEDNAGNVLWLSENYINNGIGTLAPANPIPMGNVHLADERIWIYVYDYDAEDGTQRYIGLNSYHTSSINGEITPEASYGGVSTKLYLTWSE